MVDVFERNYDRWLKAVQYIWLVWWICQKRAKIITKLLVVLKIIYTNEQYNTSWRKMKDLSFGYNQPLRSPWTQPTQWSPFVFIYVRECILTFFLVSLLKIHAINSCSFFDISSWNTSKRFFLSTIRGSVKLCLSKLFFRSSHLPLNFFSISSFVRLTLRCTSIFSVSHTRLKYVCSVCSNK